jgi:DNA-binding response OmpR family regulator
MATIVFTGLEQRVQNDLGRVLGNEGHEVIVRATHDFDGADAVFCNGDSPGYVSVLRQIRGLRPDLPIIVVTRLPESDKWLNALEAGADDYCSAPFESVQVRWILAAVMSRAATRNAA